jgi:hypothetical protein
MNSCLTKSKGPHTVYGPNSASCTSAVIEAWEEKTDKTLRLIGTFYTFYVVGVRGNTAEWIDQTARAPKRYR